MRYRQRKIITCHCIWLNYVFFFLSRCRSLFCVCIKTHQISCIHSAAGDKQCQRCLSWTQQPVFTRLECVESFQSNVPSPSFDFQQMNEINCKRFDLIGHKIKCIVRSLVFWLICFLLSAAYRWLAINRNHLFHLWPIVARIFAALSFVVVSRHRWQNICIY